MPCCVRVDGATKLCSPTAVGGRLHAPFLRGGRLEAWPFNRRNAFGPFKHKVPEAFVVKQWQMGCGA